MPRKRKEEVTIEPGKALNVNVAPKLIGQLVPGTLDWAAINEQLVAVKGALRARWARPPSRRVSATTAH